MPRKVGSKDLKKRKMNPSSLKNLMGVSKGPSLACYLCVYQHGSHVWKDTVSATEAKFLEGIVPILESSGVQAKACQLKLHGLQEEFKVACEDLGMTSAALQFADELAVLLGARRVSRLHFEVGPTLGRVHAHFILVQDECTTCPFRVRGGVSTKLTALRLAQKVSHNERGTFGSCNIRQYKVGYVPPEGWYWHSYLYKSRYVQGYYVAGECEDTLE